MRMIAECVGDGRAVLARMIQMTGVLVVGGVLVAVVVRRSGHGPGPGIQQVVGMADPMRRVEMRIHREYIDNGETQHGDHCATQRHPISVPPITSGHGLNFNCTLSLCTR